MESYILGEQHPDIDIVLPCFNPEAGWEDFIAERITRLQQLLPDRHLHVILVNDGSVRNMDSCNKNRFLELLPGSELIDQPENYGKGEAIRTGVRQATAPFIIYTDWDFPYELSGICRIVSQLEQGSDIVIVARTATYRHHKELTLPRKILSASSRIMNRLILGLKFNDTQGGLKGIGQQGKEILLQTQIKRFLFDTEFIYKAAKLKTLKICEIEVNVRQGIHLSYMGFKVMRRELLNFIKIIILSHI